ncbi:MAG TPA: ethylbenzene dehydrogenase-related protein [bacterium]|nr:ethylbenzene dehydrogenase-related protein [bacterium]
MRVNRFLTAAFAATLVLLTACEEPANVPEPTYPQDTWFAVALTDNSWESHDVAALVRLDFGGTVRENVVAPKQVDTPPVLDGRDNDRAWDHAGATTLILEPVNGGTGIAAVSVKCVYTEEEIFFFLSWQDPTGTGSDIPGRWKYAGGEWYDRFDEDGQPDGDGELIAEDMLAFLWPNPDTYPDFDQQGCTATCHAEGGGYRHGTPRGTYIDAWVWGAGRTNPREQVSDGWMAFVGWGFDVGTAPFLANRPGDGFVPRTPLYQHTDDPNANAHYLFEEEAVPFRPEGWLGGNTVPGFVLQISDGSRADVRGRGVYSAGYWSIEVGRSLLTEDALDFQLLWPEVQGDGE